jgi:hypothetical protein
VAASAITMVALLALSGRAIWADMLLATKVVELSVSFFREGRVRT